MFMKKLTVFNTAIRPENLNSRVPTSIKTSPQFPYGVKKAKELAKTGQVFNLKRGIYRNYRFKIRSWNVLIYLDATGCIIRERQFSSIEDLVEELYWMSCPLKVKSKKRHKKHSSKSITKRGTNGSL